jgi:hypothetical protein
MIRTSTKWLTILCCVIGASGCGGGDAGTDCSKVSSAGLDPGQTAISLSLAQQQQLCDVTACQVGGYGVVLTCSSGPAVTAPTSQSDCLTKLPTMANNPACTVTVGEFMACMQAVNANSCVSTFLADPACVNVTTIACLTIITNATSALMSVAQ